MELGFGWPAARLGRLAAELRIGEPAEQASN